MKQTLFDFDSPVIQFLSRIGDLIILNVVFVLCCVPILTGGAAMAAMTKVCQNFTFEMEPGLVKSFFRAFKRNFRQATLVWLCLIVFAVALIFDWQLVGAYLPDVPRLILRGIVLLLALMAVGFVSYLFPLMVRYDNTMREHCLNALALLFGKLPRTLILVVLHGLTPVLAYLSPVTFLKSISFWFIIGCAVISYLNAILVSPVLKKLEGWTPPPTGEEDEEAVDLASEGDENGDGASIQNDDNENQADTLDDPD